MNLNFILFIQINPITWQNFIFGKINTIRDARPVFACRDWDWDSVYPVPIFDTETETFKKFVSNFETET